jgi:hypothetical protein
MHLMFFDSFYAGIKNITQERHDFLFDFLPMTSFVSFYDRRWYLLDVIHPNDCFNNFMANVMVKTFLTWSCVNASFIQFIF